MKKDILRHLFRGFGKPVSFFYKEAEWSHYPQSWNE
jgi:hypothetical protein